MIKECHIITNKYLKREKKMLFNVIIISMKNILSRTHLYALA